jgi:hypothetical protein
MNPNKNDKMEKYLVTGASGYIALLYHEDQGPTA